jgi:AcrR family transcriptional regulator
VAKQTLSGMKLTRAGIVAAARQIIETEGVGALSMRKLASVLGSSPMAIYHHVEGRADLLTAVLSDLAEHQERPQLPEAPLDRMLFAAAYTHASMLALPWVIEVVRSRIAFGRGGMWTVDTFFGAGAELGLTDEQTMHLYMTAWRFIVGDVLMRSPAPGASVGAESQPGAQTEGPTQSDAPWHERIASAGLDDFPAFARMRAHWEEYAQSFDSASELAALIRRAVASATAQGS